MAAHARPPTADGNRLPGPLRLAAGLAAQAARPLEGGIALGRRAERRARGALELAALDALGAAAESRFAEEAIDRLLANNVPERIATRLVDGPELERIVDAVLASPGIDRLVERVVESPSVERLVTQVIESHLVDVAVARLLESDDLWLLVDEIARSPSVTDAISQQGLGFADQVAGVVRERSDRADARLERVARRLLRRSTSGQSPAPSAGT